MNQDIEMLNTIDLNSQYMQHEPQEYQQQAHFNAVTPGGSINPSLGDQLNDNYSNNLNLDLANHQSENLEEIGDDMSSEDNDDAASNQNEDDEDDEINAMFLADGETKTPGEILDEFSQKLEDINTTLPDSVINYYMRKSGFIVNDPKLIKIISIASQKFLSEIVNDVWQRQRLKTKQGANVTSQTPNATTSSTSATTSGTNASGSASGGASSSTSGSDQNKNTKSSNSAGASNTLGSNPNAINAAQLTLEDLTQVLADYGINVKKPYYFI